MSRTAAILALPMLAITAPALAGPEPAPATAPLTADEAAMKAHVVFLADDAMQGREPGTPEFTIAANYVATQMMAAGLEPAGDKGSYFQRVPLVAAEPGEPGTLTLTRGGKTSTLSFGTDAVTYINKSDPDFKIDGDVVFAGYGVVEPGEGIDDYAGLDVRGKIVAVLYGGPPQGLQSEIQAHFGDPRAKARIAQTKGAKGILFLESSYLHSVYPFERIVDRWKLSSMIWAEADGRAHQPGVPGVALLSFAGAEKLFAGSPLDWKQIQAADIAKLPVPRGPVGVNIAVHQQVTLTTIDSVNVVGKLPGSDPALKGQYVALSAHLDHLGIDPDAQPGEDAIYNGAMDNAVGTASLIEVAKLFQKSGETPRRSLLFISVTAEEKGLIGSEYYALNPTVPKDALVADVNLDMPILTYDFQDMIVYGADRTSIGPVVAKVAETNGLKTTPDPTPEEASFVRSDHYSFVQAGIPAVSLDTGPAGPGKAAIADFLEHHYHQVSDEVGLIDFTAGRKFVKVNYEITQALANGDERPHWNKGDFFGVLYDGFGAQ